MKALVSSIIQLAGVGLLVGALVNVWLSGMRVGGHHLSLILAGIALLVLSFTLSQRQKDTTHNQGIIRAVLIGVVGMAGIFILVGWLI